MGAWRVIAILAGIAFYLAIAYSANEVLGASQREAAIARSLAAMSAPEQAIERSAKTALERLTLGMYQGARPLRTERARQLDDLHSAQRHTRRASIIALSLVGALALAAIGARAWVPASERAHSWMAMHLYASAAILLLVGIAAPILTIDAGQDVVWLGRVVLSHQTKSLLGTVDDLVSRGHWPVALLLASFSLVVPALKLVLAMLALGMRLGGRNSRYSELAHEALGHLGKWSMTDVFVVAVLVAFLSANQANTTEARVGVGLYFFAAHVLLGLLANTWVGKAPVARARDSAPPRT